MTRKKSLDLRLELIIYKFKYLKNLHIVIVKFICYYESEAAIVCILGKH